MNKLYGYPALALAAAILAGCASPPPERPTDEEVLRQFGCEAVSSPPANEVKTLPAIDLYIDDSESMQGYVRPASSEYSAMMDLLRSNLATVNCSTTVYRLSDPARPLIANWLPEDVNRRWFYSAITTPLDSLLIEHVLLNDGISLLITDFVQSTKKEDQQAKLQNALRELTTRELEIELFGFRGRFIGSYFKESLPKNKFSFGADDNVVRPFYLLLVAPNRELLEHFKRAILFGIEFEHSFRPREKPLLILNCEHHVPAEYGDSPWKRERRHYLIGDGMDSTRWMSVFSLRHPKKKIAEPLSIDIRFEPVLDVLDASKMEISVEKTTMLRNRCFTPVAAERIRAVASEAEAGKQYRLDVALPKPEPMTWDIYRIRLRGGVSNLNVPRWVGEWSTFIDDDDPVNRGKTLNLLNSIRTMVLNISVNT
ncbi:hypothetical protein KKG66_05060, partial [bacterium]|nr:hypothetical protein [bacterium]